MILLFDIVTFFTVLFLAIILYNFFTAPVLGKSTGISVWRPFVSVLIPARNEEKNILSCVSAAADSEYPEFEIIVYDDNSTDNTLKVAEEITASRNNIRVISGAGLPQGWLGKNYACSKLSEAASGDVLLFIDADVKISPASLKDAVSFMDNTGADMLSVFPTQKYSGPGDALVTPLMKWILLTFLPLKKVYTSPNPAFAAANGQFLMIKKEVYEDTGGHTAVKDKVTEDMEIIRNIKKAGYKGAVLLGGDSVFCRMYGSFREAVNGFSKNYFPGSGTGKSAFVFFNILFMVIFLLPFLLVFINIVFIVPVIIILAGRLLITILTRGNYLYNLLLHPVQMAVLFYIAIRSVYVNKSGKAEWKGRKI